MTETKARLSPERLAMIRLNAAHDQIRCACTPPPAPGFQVRAEEARDLLTEIDALEHELAIAQQCAIRDAREVITLALDRDRARAERDAWELRAWRLGWDRD